MEEKGPPFLVGEFSGIAVSKFGKSGRIGCKVGKQFSNGAKEDWHDSRRLVASFKEAVVAFSEERYAIGVVCGPCQKLILVRLHVSGKKELVYININ